MQTDWNFVLNLLLFVGVLIAIIRIIKGKSKYSKPKTFEHYEVPDDDIISVRKISTEETQPLPKRENIDPEKNRKNVMLFLLAKEGKFSGFDLLHILLAQGLRYGDKQIFHYYEDNGKGRHIFSVAAATEDGVFNLNTLKEFSVNGLCMFFEPQENKTLDTQSFKSMYEMALKLSEALNAYILDDKRNVINDDIILRYYQAVN